MRITSCQSTRTKKRNKTRWRILCVNTPNQATKSIATMTVTQFPPLLSQDDCQKYKVPLKWRDRCAAYFALYQTCLIRQSANSSVSCKHDKHSWEECENLDLIRRKEELKVAKDKRREELAAAKAQAQDDDE